MDALSQVCRLCLRENEMLLENEATPKASVDMRVLNGNEELLEQIHTLTSLQVLDIDANVLLYLCATCENTLDQCTMFRKQCIVNDAIFRNKVDIEQESEPSISISATVTDSIPSDVFQIKAEPLIIQPDEEETQHSIGLRVNDENIPIMEHYREESEHDDVDEEDELASSSEGNHPESPTKPERKLTAKSKLYQCSICQRILRSNRNLKLHMTSHTEEKPYACNVCGKTFARTAYRNLHQKKHNGWRPHGCDQCEKRFTTSNELNNHRNSHKDEKSYECPVCKKRFRYAPNLRAHMPRHKEGNARACSVCGKVLSDPGSLTLHMRSHAAKKVHSCDACAQRFRSKVKLQQHMRLHADS